LGEVQKQNMSTYKCPKGHLSTEPDYCSECGAKIQGISEVSAVKNAVAATVPKTVQAIINCPDCGTPHEPDSGNFCEICGYNFATGARGEVPITPVATINKIDIATIASQPLTSNFDSAPTKSITPPRAWDMASTFCCSNFNLFSATSLSESFLNLLDAL